MRQPGTFGADARDDPAQGERASQAVRRRGHGQDGRPPVDEGQEMFLIQGPVLTDPGPADLPAEKLSPDGLPGRDVGHVIDVGDDQVGVLRDSSAEGEGQREKGGGRRAVEADLSGARGMEEVGGQRTDPVVKIGRDPLAGDDGPRHGIEAALGLAGRLRGLVDGQAPGARVEIDAGVAQRIAVDHREAGPDAGMDGFERSRNGRSFMGLSPRRE
jgi:hypothetical protein